MKILDIKVCLWMASCCVFLPAKFWQKFYYFNVIFNFLIQNKSKARKVVSPGPVSPHFLKLLLHYSAFAEVPLHVPSTHQHH